MFKNNSHCECVAKYMNIAIHAATVALAPFFTVHISPSDLRSVPRPRLGCPSGSRSSRSGLKAGASTSAGDMNLSVLHSGHETPFLAEFLVLLFIMWQHTAQTLPPHSEHFMSCSSSQTHSKQIGHFSGTNEGVSLSSLDDLMTIDCFSVPRI